jgi:hypothetical protein
MHLGCFEFVLYVPVLTGIGKVLTLVSSSCPYPVADELYYVLIRHPDASRSSVIVVRPVLVMVWIATFMMLPGK